MALSEREEFELLSLERERGTPQVAASPPQVAASPPQAGSTEDLAGSTVAQRVAANPVTRAFTGGGELALGAAQTVAHYNPISRALGQDEWIADKLKTLRGMQKTGGHEGFDWAGLAGSLFTPMAGVSKLPLAATAAGRAGQSAAIGAGIGAAVPVEDMGSFGATKAGNIAGGAVLGPALSGAISGGGKLAAVARNVVDPMLPGGADRLVTRTLNTAAGDKRADILDLLTRPGPNRLPQAGAGEVAAPAGRAEFSALQKIVEPSLPSAYRDAAKAQDAARLAAVRSVGQDKPALDAAEAVRSANAKTNYGTAYKNAIRADPKLAVMSSDPFFKSALPEATKLAEAHTVRTGEEVGLTQFLHFVKVSLDDAVGKKTGDTALSASGKEAVQSLRERLISWMGVKNPAYEAARAKFAADSKPINQMQVGQYLENKLVPAVNDFEASANQRSGAYAAALRDAPGTIKRSTKFKQDSLDDVLTPEQGYAVKAVGQDLGRKAQYEDLARAGAPAARDLVAPTQAPAAGMFSPVYSVAKSIFNRLEGRVSGKALELLAAKMQDPAEVAKALTQMRPADQRAVLEELFQKGVRATAAGAASQQ